MTALRIVSIAAFAALATAMPRPAVAQDSAPAAPTRVEIGGSVTFIQTMPTGGPRFTLNFNSRHAIQTGADLRFYDGDYSQGVDAFYTVEYRYTVPARLAATRIFITAGLAGTLEWYHDNAYTSTYGGYTYTGVGGQQVTVPVSEYTSPARSGFDGMPPVYPIVGAGFERRLNSRLLARADAQVIVFIDDELYVVPRVAFGLVVSLGKPVR